MWKQWSRPTNRNRYKCKQSVIKHSYLCVYQLVDCFYCQFLCISLSLFRPMPLLLCCYHFTISKAYRVAVAWHQIRYISNIDSLFLLLFFALTLSLYQLLASTSFSWFTFDFRWDDVIWCEHHLNRLTVMSMTMPCFWRKQRVAANTKKHVKHGFNKQFDFFLKKICWFC